MTRAAGQLLASFPDDHRGAMVPVMMGRRRGAGHGRWPYWGPGWADRAAARSGFATTVERARHTLGRLHGVRRSVNHA
jgi:hypothetical protein